MFNAKHGKIYLDSGLAGFLRSCTSGGGEDREFRDSTEFGRFDLHCAGSFDYSLKNI
jgi:hypothetical protein